MRRISSAKDSFPEWLLALALALNSPHLSCIYLPAPSALPSLPHLPFSHIEDVTLACNE